MHSTATTSSSRYGVDSLEERLRRRPEVAVQQDLARLVEDAQVHGAGVEIDPAVVLVLLRVEPHEGLLA